MQLPGLLVTFPLNFQTLVTILVAGMTSAGADWLIHDHPALQKKRVTIEHWLVPGLTAYIIGLPLAQVTPGAVWWIGFLLGAVLLMIVLIAEYIVVDPQDARFAPAVAILTAVSFALFLILAVTLRFSGIRLVYVIPALAIAAWLVSIRTLHLRLHGRWAFVEAGIITLIIIQLAVAFFYFPLSHISYGLILLGPAYALTSLLADLAQGNSLRNSLVEPFVVIFFAIGVALWVH